MIRQPNSAPLPAATRCPLCHQHCPDIQHQAKPPGRVRRFVIATRKALALPHTPVICIANDDVIGWR